ncbi:hypothetical protein U1Q18_041325 [Sarracenia purpurea var. burkii]
MKNTQLAVALFWIVKPAPQPSLIKNLIRFHLQFSTISNRKLTVAADSFDVVLRCCLRPAARRRRPSLLPPLAAVSLAKPPIAALLPLRCQAPIVVLPVVNATDRWF